MTSLCHHQQQQQQLQNQYTPIDPYDNNFSYYHYLSTKSNAKLPEKPSLSLGRQFSISSLLKKRPSLMGRKLSIFSRSHRNNNKSQLSIITTPSDLERTDSLTTASTGSSYSDEEVYDPPYTTSYLSVDLETALTTPTDHPTKPIDYSGKKYSNFYIKLPNGNWMVRIRDANRKIVGTYEIDGSMI